MEQTISVSKTPVALNEQLSADLAGEVVILNLKNGVYYGLDGVGYRVWGLIQEHKTVQQILDAIQQEYDVESGCCERDLVGLLQRLTDEELIEVK